MTVSLASFFPRLRSSPLLLAASAGALSALKCLIDLGAVVLRKDESGMNVIHLAAMRFHTNILEFFIQWNHPDVHVWKILVGTRALMGHQRVVVKLLNVTFWCFQYFYHLW